MIDSFDDFIRGGFVGSDGTLHSRTRVGTMVHLQGFGDGRSASLRPEPCFAVSALRVAAAIARKEEQ